MGEEGEEVMGEEEEEAMEVVGERNRMPRGKKKMPHSFLELVFASFHCMPLVLLARWLLLINDFSLF